MDLLALARAQTISDTKTSSCWSYLVAKIELEHVRGEQIAKALAELAPENGDWDRFDAWSARLCFETLTRRADGAHGRARPLGCTARLPRRADASSSFIACKASLTSSVPSSNAP
jgi:hypothetical protein